MDPLEAFEWLVTRAHERTSVGADSRLSRHLGLAQDNYIATWRLSLKDPRNQGPSFVTILPLLEAAGVFANELGEVEDLLGEVDRLKAVIAALAEQQRRQRPGREEAEE